MRVALNKRIRKRPTSKVVLITGCSSGIGFQLCLTLHHATDAKGAPLFRVFATARRVEALAPLEEQGIDTLTLDVLDTESVESAVAAVRAKAGRIDVCICNAGITLHGPLLETEVAKMDRVMQTNVVGVVRMIQAVAPTMIQQGGGRILTMSSVMGRLAFPFVASYCASKAALEAFSDVARMELQPFGVHVTVVSLGAVKSEIAEKADDDLDRYASDASFYKPVAAEIRKLPRLVAQREVPTEAACIKILRGLTRKRVPRRIVCGGDARLLTLLGFVQKWMFPSTTDGCISRMFGLNKLS